MTAHPLPRAPQTGAGKTFTMCGDARSFHHRGVIPRALAHVFRGIETRPDRIYRRGAAACGRGARRAER